MSESPKMGLFGSKDDNTDENDKKKDSDKPNEASQHRSAPYNIDSDSEAYDTEALSIMDINDIIGIQAESAGDSTLESEIAALSEVITDIKSEDVTSGSSKTSEDKKSNVMGSDSNTKTGNTEDKGSEKDSSKKDVCSQEDANKPADSAKITGINKSLQLIGEAYDSDDSQDADTTDLPSITAPMSANLSEQPEKSTNEDAQVAGKNSDEAEITADDLVQPNQTIADESSLELEKNAALDKSVETAIKPPVHDLKVSEIEKSADSTDSSSELSKKTSVEDDKNEIMDIDSPPEKIQDDSVEKVSANNPEKSAIIEKVADKSIKDSSDVNNENIPFEHVIEAEEPMEVDQPSEQVSDFVETEKVDTFATEKVSEEVETEKGETVATEIISDNVRTEKMETVPTDQVSDEVETEKVETVAVDEVSDEVEAEKVETIATEKVSDEVEAEKIETIATEKVSDEVEAEKIEIIATEKVSDEVKTEKVETVATEKASDEFQTEKVETVATEKVSDEVETDKVKTVATEKVPDEVMAEKVETLATEKVSDEVESEKVETVCTEKDSDNIQISKPDIAAIEAISNRVVSEKSDFDATEDVAVNNPRSSNLNVSEVAEKVTEMIIDREEISNAEKKTAECVIREKSSNEQTSTGETSNPETDEIKAPKSVEKDLKKSINDPGGPEIAEESLEMEIEDSQIKESCAAKDQTFAAEESNFTNETNKPETSTEKTKVENEIISEHFTPLDQLISHVSTSKECEKTSDNEPMEIDEHAEYQENESDKKTVKAAELADNSVDTVKAVKDIVISLIESENLDKATDSCIISPEIKETVETETILDSELTEGDKNKIIASTSILSENSAKIVASTSGVSIKEQDECKITEISDESSKNSAEIGEISNVELKERMKDETSGLTELNPNFKEIVESVDVVLSKDNASDKINETQVEIIAESAIIDEAMETEDITLEMTSGETLPSESTEKSTPDVENVVDFIPGVNSDVKTQEIAQEDEKMEVDGVAKKEKQKDEESEICRSEVTSAEAEKSVISTEGKNSLTEEKTIIEAADNFEKIEITEQTIEKVTEISGEAANRFTSEMEATKSVDETDEANQDLKIEENLSPFVSQKAEVSDEKNLKTPVTDTFENILPEVTKDEDKEVETESKKEESVAPIIIQQPETSNQRESSTDKVHEIEATEKSDDFVAEIMKNEEKEVKSESKNEKNAASIVVKDTEIIHEKQATETSENITAQITKDEEKELADESKNEENFPSTVVQQSESSTDKFDEIQATELAINVTPEVAKDEKEEINTDTNEGENLSLILVENAESSNKNIQENVSTETLDNVVSEITKETEIESRPTKVEINVVSESAESSSKKSLEEKITKPTEEDIDEDSENKMNKINPETEMTEVSISMDTSEASTDKIHKIEAIETSDKAAEESIKDDEQAQYEPKKDESVILVTNEKTETLSEIDEVEIPEISAAIIESKNEYETNKTDAITTNIEKESARSEEKFETPTAESESGMPEKAKETIKDSENVEDKIEADSMEISMSVDEKLTKTQEETSKIDEKSMNEDSKESVKGDKERENIESDSKEAEEKSQILTEVTAEISPKPVIKNVESDTEKSTSATLENYSESHFVFSKPEVTQQDIKQTDFSSSSINMEDIEEEEDPVDEEMNLSLEPEINECPEINSGEDADDDVQPIGELSLEEIPVNTNEIGNQSSIDNSLNLEKKSDEFSNVPTDTLEKLTVDDSVRESSMPSGIKKQEQSDERLEKPTNDDDDNSKDVLSTIVHVFHDEQSQNTQEMMDSILERDSSNFNKVLDDEEGVGAALDCANNLPIEETEIDELNEKLPSESEEMLNKALDDPMSSQNIDSLEGLLDLDLIQEADDATLKSVDPIVAKVMNETEEDIETKDVDVSLLLEETDQGESVDRDEYVCVTKESGENDEDVVDEVVEKKNEKIVKSTGKIFSQANLNDSIDLPETLELENEASTSTENFAVFDLPIVESNVIEDDQRETIALETNQLPTEESKLELAEDILREIAVDQERKMELAGELLLEAPPEKDEETNVPEDFLLEKESDINLQADILLQAAVKEDENKINLTEEVLITSAVDTGSSMDLVQDVMLESPVSEVPKIELSEDNSMERVVRDQVLTVAAEIEDLPPNSEISELESAVKFLQESEEQGIDSPLVLSPKMVDSVVDEIARVEDVGIFVTDADICEDPSALVAELENIIPDPIAISEAEIISEAAKLENERKTKISEEAKLKSPIIEEKEEPETTLKIVETPPTSVATEQSTASLPLPETPKSHRESRETIAKSPKPEKIEHTTILKKSAPIPKISILEERLKEPPKIEIPSVSEISRNCEIPTTPKTTNLLIQRDAKLSSFQKMLDSPKTTDKTEHKIVETPRKDSDKHDFENVGSPRIILKIAKSAIADCGEPRSPKSPKIRSATNSPNPEDSPGQKLGKIKLKLSKSGHPSIISNENVEEVCGQWHTEGTSSLSPLGMKIKFSKTGDASIVQTEKHEVAEDSKDPPKHKFEEAKRTESPIGMKIKFSRSGDASIVQQDIKESSSKHKDKSDIMQGSPKRNESPLGMKIKFSKSGDASIIQPEKSEISDDHRESGTRGKEKLDIPHDVPRRTESPLGMKFKLFKTGDASIVATEISDDSPSEIKRNDSPLGMKIKLSKSRGSASIVSSESSDDVKERLDIPEVPRRTESPLGMKIKLSKSGDASIIHVDDPKDTGKHKERAETSQDTSQITSVGSKSDAVKIKVTKSKNNPEIITSETENLQSTPKRTESSIGMKFKLSKTGDASIVHSEMQEQVEETKKKNLEKEKVENIQETPRKSDATIGMKIKFSKTGDASIIQQQLGKKSMEITESETEQKSTDSAIPVKLKLQKSGDSSIIDNEKKEKSTKRKETDSPLEMKIKLSKTGHPTIIACDNYAETSQRTKETVDVHKHKESTSLRDIPGMKMLKSMQQGITGNRTELTIEPINIQNRKTDGVNEASPKRKDITISPVDPKKAKIETKLSHMLPEVTIQPIMPREQKSIMFDGKSSSISRQQMNVISQEISITQVRSNKAMDLSITNKPKNLMQKNPSTSVNTDCEIIEHRPELIIVNENSNSSQDVMIIEEVPALRGPEAKVPKKRGRPRRNPLPVVPTKPIQQSMIDPNIPKDPLALDDIPQVLPHIASQISSKVIPINLPPKENERPKRSCSRQKSYAPPRRGRGRGGGRGKRKMEMEHLELSKKPRIDQDLSMIEQSTTALITIDETPADTDISHSNSELYKALRQPPMDHKMANAMARSEAEQAVNVADLLAKESTRESLMDSRIKSHLDGVIENSMNKTAQPQIFENERKINLENLTNTETQNSTNLPTDEIEKTDIIIVDEKIIEKAGDDTKDNKDNVNSQDQENWLTPSSIKILDGRNDGNISNVQVIDEETRMSAESSSRSQTPARNMSLQAPETIVNEESQGSVLSTATTESEKVKVRNRRMEINFDPDEGPFTVDKVAEYEWPLDPTKKSETFMIQEQISHYLGVKSFKRKYPDLKRRMVDMEERNYLRENALVSEAMCDMGLTAVCSSEVLDIMCNDFPDQYEEYRKYIRERQMKEHSKKQKELTAAANAEKNRIDLAEMAVQSALSWNVGLNKARRESRKCSLDLQTFTIHVPKKQQKVEEVSRQSHYPVALIPGQYTDYYREYTPAELRYYPLNTVLYGPMKPNERKLDSQSEGSQSDSDSDSSSDDSSSSSSDGTQDTEESQSTMDEVDVELSRQKEDIKSIKCKMCLKHLNKFSRSEVLIQCGTCNGYVHPSCIDLTLDMVPHIQAYAWQCTDCKTCAQCHDPADEDKMLFCDMCDRGYHIYCVGLRRVPQGRWHCQECAVCASCGSREAGGANSDRNSVAQWQHEYKKGDKNTRVYVSTLCVPCSKLWRKGRYCPHCSRCHTVPQLDLEANLVHCSACDKYLHLGCVETKDLTIDRKNYLCDVCQPSRQQMSKPLVSKVFRT